MTDEVISKGVSIPSISGTMTGSSKEVDNALNPAWRDSIVHIITSQSWQDTLPKTVEEETIYNMTYQRGYALRQLAPDTGCYLNEVRLRLRIKANLSSAQSTKCAFHTGKSLRA